MRRRIKKGLALFIFALWLTNGDFLLAQNPGSSTNPYAFSEKPRDCEINIIRVESPKNLADAEADRVVIAIARLGDGEYAQSLSGRRLRNVLTVLTESLGMKKERIVIASGERVHGYGRVDLYVGGQLVDALLVNRGKDLCVHCCDIDRRYYPDRRDGKR